MSATDGKRLGRELPAVTTKLGWRYHHIGIPHTRPHARERHVVHLGVHVAGFETSPYGIEWIRFDSDCPVPEIVRSVPHVAFAVDDLDEALEGRTILIAPNEPSQGVRVAFILDDGAPVELLQFTTASAVRPYRRAPASEPAKGEGKAMERTYFTDAEARAAVGGTVEAGSDFPSVPKGTRGTVVRRKQYAPDQWAVVVEWDLPRRTSTVLAMVLDASVNFTKRAKPVNDEFCKSEYEMLVRVLQPAD